MPTGLKVRFAAISTVVLCNPIVVVFVPLESVRLRLLLLPDFLLTATARAQAAAAVAGRQPTCVAASVRILCESVCPSGLNCA